MLLFRDGHHVGILALPGVSLFRPQQNLPRAALAGFLGFPDATTGIGLS